MGRMTERQSNLYDDVMEARDFVRGRTDLAPDISLTLGSGLGGLADEIENAAVFEYRDIPHFPASTAPGHAGRLLLGELAGRRVIAFQGRAHLYEGHPPAGVVFPVRLAHALGARTFVITSAAGGLRAEWAAGDLMLHRDFLNFSGVNILSGPNEDRWGERFPVLFGAYDAGLRDLVKRVARAQDQELRDGVYVGISGPSYATRAELAAYRLLGADAIGMSTVHEVTAARHLGARVVGLSTITDLAIPERDEHAGEQDVIRVAGESAGKLSGLLRGVLAEL